MWRGQVGDLPVEERAELLAALVECVESRVRFPNQRAIAVATRPVRVSLGVVHDLVHHHIAEHHDLRNGPGPFDVRDRASVENPDVVTRFHAHPQDVQFPLHIRRDGEFHHPQPPVRDTRARRLSQLLRVLLTPLVGQRQCPLPVAGGERLPARETALLEVLAALQLVEEVDPATGIDPAEVGVVRGTVQAGGRGAREGVKHRGCPASPRRACSWG
ncbi:hypothetical protein EAO77_19955 [Streptomyces sp. t39]|nr:hypothetical protein EAO77_19955 [Streptomyces sp. t39]